MGPARGPAELVAACCSLDAQAPPKWPNNLINRLKYFVLQLGDPNPKRQRIKGPEPNVEPIPESQQQHVVERQVQLNAEQG